MRTHPHPAIRALHAAALLSLSGLALLPTGLAESPPAREDVIAVMERAADFELRQRSNFPYGDWVQGPFVIGLAELAELSGKPEWWEAVERIGAKEGWGPSPRPRERWVANDHCTPQAYLELAASKPELAPAILEPNRTAADRFIERYATQGKSLEFLPEDRERWSWCDALFMSPPYFAQLAKLTGDARYSDFLHQRWWEVSDFYYDPAERLYFRDQTFFDKREPNGAKLFWSRGNGWVVAGLARVLKHLPKDDPTRPRYEAQFQAMCERIRDLAPEDGLWRASLLAPEHFPQAETSASGFFIYAFAYGINAGLLDRAAFVPQTLKGWRALRSKVTNEGRVTGVQPIGDTPERFDPNSSLPYGVGAFLLAGAEVARLGETKVSQ